MSGLQKQSQDSDDEKILEYARELFGQLGITRPEPDTVSWDETLPAESVIVQYGEVKLPRAMKGKLNREDWRPFLASSITYHYIMYKNPSKSALVRVILPNTVAVLLVTYFLLQIFKIQEKTYAQQLLFALICSYAAFAAVLVSSWVNWYSRSLVFASDRRGADLVGPDPMLLALMKYRDTVSSLTGAVKRQGFKPSLEQRIRKLQKN